MIQRIVQNLKINRIGHFSTIIEPQTTSSSSSSSSNSVKGELHINQKSSSFVNHHAQDSIDLACDEEIKKIYCVKMLSERCPTSVNFINAAMNHFTFSSPRPFLDFDKMRKDVVLKLKSKRVNNHKKREQFGKVKNFQN